jgi:hypothetical protein
MANQRRKSDEGEERESHQGPACITVTPPQGLYFDSGHRPSCFHSAGRRGRRSAPVQEWPAVCRLGWINAQATLERRKDIARWHHETRGCIPQDNADPRRSSSDTVRRSTIRHSGRLVAAPHAASPQERGHRCAGKQNRPDGLGGPDPENGLQLVSTALMGPISK